MARAIVSAVVMLAMFAKPALAADAPDVPEDVVSVANDVEVDPIDLLGALITTGEEQSADGARHYLRSVGEMAPLFIASVQDPFSGVWGRVAQCESHGNPSTNTGNRYYGMFQEDMTFWRNYGGLSYAPRPDLASPTAQLIVAQRGYAVQGAHAWPICSRVAGLR